MTVLTFVGPSDNSWVVPTGVTSVTIECWGGSGAGQVGGGGARALGGYTKCTVAATPGNTGGFTRPDKACQLFDVSSAYGAGGFVGGGTIWAGSGGGGGSFVNSDHSDFANAAKMLCVAGGGGAYGYGTSKNGGAGGGTTGGAVDRWHQGWSRRHTVCRWSRRCRHVSHRP